MKNGQWLFAAAAGFLIVILTTPGCSPPEEIIIEKQMVQLDESDLREMNPVIYKTRKMNGETSDYISSDWSKIDKPESIEEFSAQDHNSPVRQWWTSTCWCFSTVSMLESELIRQGRGEFKLSEMYIAYWEFVEKARGYIQKKGDQRFTAGSEHNAVFLRMEQYGAVPVEAYTGLLEGETEFNHGPMFKEMRAYLEFCKTNEYWDEDKAVAYIRSILDKHMGRPPETFPFDGREITPVEYFQDILKINTSDYVSLMSFKSVPFYTKAEFKVPDNWWHSTDYHNVPLDVFFGALDNALRNGYTVALGGDTSEPGKCGEADIAVVPTFDIHPKMINQDSREFRFSNRTSTDDHAIHAVGIADRGEHTWFLIKDSGSSAQQGQFKGYYFFRDDYIKLKMLVITLHRDSVADILAEFEKSDSRESGV